MKVKLIPKEPVYIRNSKGIPLPELSIENIEQLDEDQMSLEYCYELLVSAYQKSRELNEELEELSKELRKDNDKLIYICRQNGLPLEGIIYS